MKIETRYTPPAVAKPEPEKLIKVRMLKSFNLRPGVGEIDELPASQAHLQVKKGWAEYVDPKDAPPAKSKPWTFEEKDGVLFVRVSPEHRAYSGNRFRRGTALMGISVCGRHIPAGTVIDVPANMSADLTWHGRYGSRQRSVSWHDEEPPAPSEAPKEVEIPSDPGALAALAKKVMAALRKAGGAKDSQEV